MASIFSKKEKIINKSSFGTKFFARFFRFIMYIGGKLICLAVVIMLVYQAFRTADNSAQIYMLSRDAFSKRTSVILNPKENKDKDLLDGIFTEDYLEKTNLKNQEKNNSYIIKGYDIQTTVPIKVVWGWLDHYDVNIKNIVQDFDWKFDNTVVDIQDVDEFIESGEYILHFIKADNGRWYVNDVELVTKIDIESAHPTPYSEYIMDDVDMATEQTGTASEVDENTDN